MPAEILWTIPTRLDPTRRWPSGVTDKRPGRFTLFDSAVQTARAAEAAGFHGIVVPYDPGGEDSWILATALARETPRLAIVPEFQPGFATAVYTAKLALSYQRFFGDRLGWKLALATPATQQRSVGDFVEGADRLVRADELLTISRGVWEHGPYTFEGRFFTALDSGFFDGNVSAQALTGHDIASRPYPRVYLDGEAPESLRLSARHADVHLFDTAERERLEPLVETLRRLAAEAGRTVRAGLTLTVLARDNEAEARLEAQRLGHTGGLVGSFEQVADRLAGYQRLGVRTFVLNSPVPLDAYRLGERLFPLLDPIPVS